MLGKQVKEVGKKEEGGFKIVPVIRGSTYATPENEAFVKMMEDPLVYIKQKEQEARSLVYENPLKMKQIREEIEALKKGKKREKKDKKHKKHKKEKKHKKRKRSESSSDSADRSARRPSRRLHSDSSEDERTKDRSYKKDSDYHSEKSSRHHRSRSDERHRERHHRKDSRSPRDR